MINSVIDSINHIHDLEKDFKQVKSSGKYNELCRLLSYILNFSKISLENFKIIIEHTIDSINENPLPVGNFPVLQSQGVSIARPEKPDKKSLRINTSNDSKPFSESKLAKLSTQESPKSPSSCKIPALATPSSLKQSSSKPGDTARSAVVSISFSSPKNEEVSKTLEQFNKKLEKLHHGFSQDKLFET